MKKTANILTGALPENVLIQFPSGRWGFVGHVDSRLSYTMLDGSPVTAEAAAIVSGFGPALAKVRTRAWETPEAALAAAEAIGAMVTGKDGRYAR